MVMRKALAESRPFLLLSLFFGISYFLVKDSHMPGLYQMLWKGAAVGFLAAYAWARHKGHDGWLISGVMALGSLGDMLIEIDLIWGALAFLAGHLVAIWLYSRHRRAQLSFSQRALALVSLVAVPLIAFMLPSDRAEAPGIALYATGLAAMAAMAWTSSFPRYRVGLGAVLFILSDLLIFARIGPLAASPLPDLLIWPLYYAGQLLICTGVVQSLRSFAGEVPSSY